MKIKKLKWNELKGSRVVTGQHVYRSECGILSFQIVKYEDKCDCCVWGESDNEIWTSEYVNNTIGEAQRAVQKWFEEFVSKFLEQ